MRVDDLNWTRVLMFIMCTFVKNQYLLIIEDRADVRIKVHVRIRCEANFICEPVDLDPR